MTSLIPQTPDSQLLLYQTEDGHTRIEVQFKGETVWLSLNQMTDLFQRDKSVISKHIRNVFEEGELGPDSTVAKFATVQTEGNRSVTRKIEFYNLDVIISVGYRVKSHRGTQFRIWATQQLKEYIIKGFALDDRRLKNAGGGNYFKELLARIRDIRTSEKVFWRQVGRHVVQHAQTAKSNETVRERVYDKCAETIKNNGIDDDEISKSGLTSEPAITVNAPRIAECFLNLQCEYLWERVNFPNSKYVTTCVRIKHVAMESDHFDENRKGRYSKTGYIYNIHSPFNPEDGELSGTWLGAIEKYARQD